MLPDPKKLREQLVRWARQAHGSNPGSVGGKRERPAESIEEPERADWFQPLAGVAQLRK